MRFENTPELFGNGAGTSTCGDFTCGICGTRHNEGNDVAQSYGGESVGVTNFAGLEVCEDCFETVENEILRRMPHILSWYRRIVEKRQQSLEKSDAALKAVGA